MTRWECQRDPIVARLERLSADWGSWRVRQLGGAMSALHHGFTAGLLSVWLQHWPVAFAVALPTAWVVLPGIRRMLERLSRPQPAPVPGRLG